MNFLVLDIASHTGRGDGELSPSNCLKMRREGRAPYRYVPAAAEHCCKVRHDARAQLSEHRHSVFQPEIREDY